MSALTVTIVRDCRVLFLMFRKPGRGLSGLPGRASDVKLFGDRQSVNDFDAKVPHGALHPLMSE